MSFNSVTYLIFLPLVVLLYWVCPQRFRNALLLIASYIFYMSWMKIYGLLLLCLTTANYLAGLALGACKTVEQKRLVFVGGLAINLGCLMLFKYTNFLIDTVCSSSKFLSSLAHQPELSLGWSALPIILPLGISFFVFEFIHYLVDIFKGEKPMRSPIQFALFAAFFPSQIAGPIKRYQDFQKQLTEAKSLTREDWNAGLKLIIQGLFKKAVLGDNLAPIVQTGFSAPQLMGTVDAWICVIAFAWQIYFDFSGYTDIGIGSARLLGFKLPENFNLPYIATSIRDFWHRWHISLSTWLRDYLYIPLGGSRKGKSGAAMNALITMFLGGLWHGAAWHFVVWGLYQGVGLAINRVLDAQFERSKTMTAVLQTGWWQFISRVFTFVVVCIGWVLFRVDHLNDAGTIYRAMFMPCLSTNIDIVAELAHSTFGVALVLYLLAGLAFIIFSRTQAASGKSMHDFVVPAYVQVILLLGFGLLVDGLAPHRAIPFIYFQF